MATAPKTPPPFRFGKPEKRDWLKIILIGVFVFLALGGIIWMIVANPRQHSLSCNQSTGAGLWTAMGRCTEN